MNQRIDAIFENGVFRPEVPVQIANGQRVLLNVEPKGALIDELRDIGDLLDLEFMEECRRNGACAPTLEDARSMLGGLAGSLAERISAERDEH